MPPRRRYTAEKILDAAMALTRARGVETVTARSLASELGCSTAPIFSHFASMDALYEQLMDQIIARFVAMAGSVSHDDPLIGAGIGWLRFAAEEPRLYEAVFLRPHPWHAKWGPVRRQLAARMATHERYSHLDKAARFALVGRASIVMHGLGVEIWSGRMPRHDLSRLIKEFAVPVVETAMARGWTEDLHSSPIDHQPQPSTRTP